MIRLVCYDIRSPKRLRKVAKVCERYGIRLQRSCFQCDADNDRLRALIRDMGREIDKKQDSVIAYSICKDCVTLSIIDGPNKILDPDRCVFL